MNNLGQHNNMFSLACLVGLNWSNGSNTGVFASNLSNARSNSNDNASGRDFSSKPETTMVETGTIGICCPANSEIENKFSLLSNTIEKQTKTKRIGYLFEKISYTFTSQTISIRILSL